MWRTHKTCTWYRKLRSSVVNFQAHARGYLTRHRISEELKVRSVPIISLPVRQIGKILILIILQNKKSKSVIALKGLSYPSKESKESSQEDVRVTE